MNTTVYAPTLAQQAGATRSKRAPRYAAQRAVLAAALERSKAMGEAAKARRSVNWK